jgi:MYXO-CTERM domain-containing protein
MSRNNLPVAPVACAAALAALLAAGTAGAYCRTTSCMQGMPHSAQVCQPPESDDCGVPLFWASHCIGYSVQQDASKQVTFAQTEQVLKSAFASWTSAACPGGTPQMQVTEAAKAVCHQQQYNQTVGNANVIMYHDDMWPYEGQANATLALTTVTYNLDTGEIYDADMELNTADTHFTLGDTGVGFDLLSVVTHETGHFLGMAHSHDPTATMWPQYNPGTINLRHLSADDIAGICAIYPPTPVNNDCNATPRHGFSPLCAAQQPPPPRSGTCSATAPGSAPTGSGAGMIAALGALVFAARRRSRSA